MRFQMKPAPCDHMIWQNELLGGILSCSNWGKLTLAFFNDSLSIKQRQHAVLTTFASFLSLEQRKSGLQTAVSYLRSPVLLSAAAFSFIYIINQCKLSPIHEPGN